LVPRAKKTASGAGYESIPNGPVVEADGGRKFILKKQKYLRIIIK
jgi:hypothetical protein